MSEPRLTGTIKALNGPGYPRVPAIEVRPTDPADLDAFLKVFDAYDQGYPSLDEWEAMIEARKPKEPS